MPGVSEGEGIVVAGLDSYQGFLLLLLIPLVFILQRRRSRLQAVILTTFPLLEKVESDIAKPPPVIFRLRKKYRQALVALVVFITALAYNGAHLRIPRSTPGEYLLVIDNLHTLTPRAHGSSLHELIEQVSRKAAGLMGAGDRIAVMVTGPKPRIVTVLSHGSTPILPPIAAADRFTAVPDVIDFIGHTFPNGYLEGIVVISPRADQWREASSTLPEGQRISIPPDREVRFGNAGIVALDARPSPRKIDTFDLYFRATSHGLDTPPTEAILKKDSEIIDRVELNWNGSETIEYIYTDAVLPPGLVTVSLNVEDAFPLDNRVNLRIGAPSRTRWRWRGESNPILEKALQTLSNQSGSATGFDNGPAVDLFLGTPPKEELSGPSVIIMPERGFLDFQYRRSWENPGDPAFHPAHSITRNVAFQNFRPGQVLEFSLPSHFRILGRAGRIPLIFAGETDGHRLVVWTFNPLNNGIFLEPSFLILLEESLLWAAGEESVSWTRPGEIGNPIVTGSDGKTPGTIQPNVLSQAVTEAGSAVHFPDISRLQLQEDRDLVTQRVELSPLLLTISCVFLLYLAVVNAYEPGVLE